MADKLTREQALEYYDFLQKEEGLTPAQASEFMGETIEVDGMGLWGAAKQAGSLGLDVVSRVGDWAGGMARTGLATHIDPALKLKALLEGKEHKPIVNQDDMVNALIGKAPDTSEYMDRSGVGEMGSVETPFGTITGRDVVGFGGDMLLDPTTYGSLGIVPLLKQGLKGASVANKILNPVGNLAQKGGKGMYRSAFKKIDEKLDEKAVKRLSETLWENGKIRGSANSIRDQVQKLKKGLIGQRDVLHKEAKDLGVKVDVEDASQLALNEARRLQGVRGAEGTGQALETHIRSFYEPVDAPFLKTSSAKSPGYKIEPIYGPHGEVLNADELSKVTSSLNGGTVGAQTTLVDDFDSLGMPIKREVPVGAHSGGTSTMVTYQPKEVPSSTVTATNVVDPRYRTNPLTLQKERIKYDPLEVEEATEVKTRFYNTLPASAYDVGGKIKSDAQLVSKLQARGLKEQIEKQGNLARTGLGDEIAHVNEDLGSIIGSRKALNIEVGKENTRNAVTSVDGMIAGAAAIDPKNAAILGAKKAADISKMVRTKTRGGVMLHTLGSGGVMDPLLRRTLAESQDEEINPWILMPSILPSTPAK